MRDVLRAVADAREKALLNGQDPNRVVLSYSTARAVMRDLPDAFGIAGAPDSVLDSLLDTGACMLFGMRIVPFVEFRCWEEAEELRGRRARRGRVDPGVMDGRHLMNVEGVEV